MNLTISYNYEMRYLPTQRHKKTRKVCMEAMLDLEIPEVTEEEFPLAFEVTKKESVYPGAKDYRDFEQKRETSEYRLFTHQIRKFHGLLYQEVFVTCGAGISTLHATPEEYIKDSLQVRTCQYTPEQDLPYKEGASVVVSSDREKRKEILINSVQKYKLCNGILWMLCAEPIYVASYSSQRAFVDIKYFRAEKLQTFQYSAYEREQLLEDLKAHQEKYCLDDDNIHFSCNIKVFDDTAIQHYHPRILKVSVFCQAVYETIIELPKDFTGDLEDAIEYADDSLKDIPLGELKYIPGSDELDREGCYLV